MRSGAGRHTMYAESYYFGNPGNFQCWVVASSPASELTRGNLDAVLSALDAPTGVREQHGACSRTAAGNTDARALGGRCCDRSASHHRHDQGPGPTNYFAGHAPPALFGRRPRLPGRGAALISRSVGVAEQVAVECF